MTTKAKKSKGLPLEDFLSREMKSEEFRIHFEERRFYLQVAHLVTDLRARAGISQAELARAAKVSQPLIARLEKGDQRRTPTFETIAKILSALGYRLDLRVVPGRKSRGLKRKRPRYLHEAPQPFRNRAP